MHISRALSAIVAVALLGCTQAVDSSAAEATPSTTSAPDTAVTAGALADTARVPGPSAAIDPADCEGSDVYCPSADQVRVDQSFSPFAIDSLRSAAGGALTQIVMNGCDQSNECDWRDRTGVRHFLWGDSPAELRVVVKSIDASEFGRRPISALGIGTARRQAEVLANVRRFLPGVAIDCNPQHVSGNVGPVECGATLNPGWIQIGFDRDGNLLRVRFDGYQFT